MSVLMSGFRIQTPPGTGLHQESRLFANDFVLTLLWWRDEKQIIDLDEAEELRSAKRSDWRDE